ncbi:MAG TPA: glycosyltransferase [Rhabdochlamydiaceae bacterium]|jgi:hypothetical protein
MKEIFWFFLALFPLLHASEKRNFDALMGKETKHWGYVTERKDKDFLRFAKEIFDVNQAYEFTAEGPYKIPRVIHFIWLGPKHFPPESVENVRTWIAQNSDWKIKFWTDRKREVPCDAMEIAYVSDFSFEKLRECYCDSDNWGEKSDILRYEILWQEGGVYVDHDANCLQPFDGLHRGYDLYCGMETPHPPFVGKAITCGNGVIGARKGHPTIAKVTDLIHNRWASLKHKFRGRDHYSKMEIVIQRTYMALTDAVCDTLNREGNRDIILPAAYFFAKNRIPPLYSQHFFANSWDELYVKKTATERLQLKMLSKLLRDSGSLVRYLSIIAGFFFFLIIYLVKWGLKKWPE